MSGIRIVIQQRLRLFREGLRMLLEDEPDLVIVGTAVSGDEVVPLTQQLQPDVVVFELDAPEWDSCRLAARLHRAATRARLVATYAEMGDAELLRARQSGLRWIISQDAGLSGVLDAVRAAPHYPAPSIRAVSDLREGGPLTRREIDVLALVGAGWTSQQISDRLTISRKTVEKHKQRIFGKLGVQNQAHAVAIAARQGLITPEEVLDLSDAG